MLRQDSTSSLPTSPALPPPDGVPPVDPPRWFLPKSGTMPTSPRTDSVRRSETSVDTQPEELPPKLYHTLHQQNNSVLSLAADDRYIYSGSQGQHISVWDKATLALRSTLIGHSGSVLALEYARDKQWLFSASGDSTVRIWCTKTHRPLYVLHPFLETESGDLFSLAWSSTLQTIYVGCQDTSIQYFCFSESLSDPAAESGSATPSRRIHKFFDSYPKYTRRPPDLNARNPCTPSDLSNISSQLSRSSTSSESLSDCVQGPTPMKFSMLNIPPTNVVYSAHYGYVYCMALVPQVANNSVQLVTGSGDATVKLWGLSVSETPALLHTFDCATGAVLALVVNSNGETIYAGCQDGHIKVWDLETKTLVRTIITIENVDILALSLLQSDLYTCSANGQVQRWSASFDLTASWTAHDGIVLSSIITRVPSTPSLDTTAASFEHNSDLYVLITGANDDRIKVWEVEPSAQRIFRGCQTEGLEDGVPINSHDQLIDALSQFVSIPSVSNSPPHREDCRQAAIWLRKYLTQLGAEESMVLPTGDNTNPLVLATFRGTESEHRKPRVIFYGHYDVISAPPHGWSSDPFTVTGQNGYLHGRGVADNKGPVLAAAFATADLLRRRALGLDIVFLIEGEEEAGSGGFAETVKKYKDSIGPIDAIVVSNSTWIAEDTPCITYGTRGLVCFTVDISNNGPDLHSGLEGGAAPEPMLDMIKLLGTLLDDKNQVTLPGFYDSVRPVTDEERQLYTILSGVTQSSASSLAARWRQPALSIHNFWVSGAHNTTLIPAQVVALVSIRTVPDQSKEHIISIFTDHIKAEFEKLHSRNSFEVKETSKVEWWLGDLNDRWFKALERAIQDEWGRVPLRIREGGSVPSVPFLEKEFSCHAVHLPMAQSSAQAHFPNERMSLANLRRGKSILERFFLDVANMYMFSNRPET